MPHRLPPNLLPQVQQLMPMLPADSLARLEDYARELLRWNEVMNLVSRRDAENLWAHHLLHSLCLPAFWQPEGGLKVLDVGSGGGLPGIPLAILRPDLEITLVDSIRKKTDALRAMADALHLTNLTVLTARVEDLPRQWQAVTGRAVAALPVFYGWAQKVLLPHAPIPRVWYLTGTDQLQRAHNAKPLRVIELEKHLPLEHYRGKLLLALR